MAKAHRVSCSPSCEALASWKSPPTEDLPHVWPRRRRAARSQLHWVEALPRSNRTATSRSWLYLSHHAPAHTLSVERDARPPSDSLAQPLSALAHGNLLRPQDGQDRLR